MNPKLPYSDVVTALSHALDLRRGQRPGHSVRSALIGMEMGGALGLSAAERSPLYYALLLSHGGRSFLEPRSHTEIARASELALELGFGRSTSRALRYLGERWDGTGRPEGLVGPEIPLLSRICAVARITDRALVDGGVPEIREFLTALRGNRLDPRLVDLVLSWSHRDAWWADIRAVRHADALYDVEPRDEFRLLSQDKVDRIAEIFARIIDAKGSSTYGHSQRVGEIARAIAYHRGMSDAEARRLYRAGLLHDIGKLALPSLFLHKPAALSPEQVALIRTHPVHSYEVLRNVAGFADIAQLAAYHHERLDGTGYPWGLTGESLNEECRIMAVADVYEALTADRPYRAAMPPDQAMEILRTDAPRRLDIEIVDTLAGALDRAGRLRPPPPTDVVPLRKARAAAAAQDRTRPAAGRDHTCERWGWVRVS